MAQINQLPVHNILSFNGPPAPDGRDRLTAEAGAVAAFPFKFGAKDLVEAVTLACDSTTGTTGPANCGWTPAYDGVCSPQDTIGVALTPGTNQSSFPLMLQVQQGVHAHNYPFMPDGLCATAGAGCFDGDFLGASVAGISGNDMPNPLSVQFTCPQSGTIPGRRRQTPSLTFVSSGVAGGGCSLGAASNAARTLSVSDSTAARDIQTESGSSVPRSALTTRSLGVC